MIVCKNKITILHLDKELSNRSLPLAALYRASQLSSSLVIRAVKAYNRYMYIVGVVVFFISIAISFQINLQLLAVISNKCRPDHFLTKSSATVLWY